MSRYWDTEEIIMHGDEYFDRMIQDILLAKEYITIEMYMFNDDLLGKKIATALIGAHQRGVKVQIMVDGVGSYEFFKKLYGTFKMKGVFIKMFNPLPFFHPYFGNVGFIRKLQLWGTRMVRLNKRNHRKIITIDQNVMYVGSFNFSVEHTTMSLQKPWKDIGARVSGANVKFAVLNFKRVWKIRDYYRFKKQFQEKGVYHWKNSPLRLNQNIIRKRFYQKDILDRIEASVNHVWLATPYFIPKRKLIRSLGRASKRGVDVKILISHRSDIIFFRTLQFFYYPYLLKKGVQVIEYKDTILHEKSFIIDEWVTIGTSNLNHRSLLHDLEVDLVVENEKNRALLRNDFIRSCQGQMIINETSLNHRTFQDKILGRLFFLFKYWF